MNKTQAIVFFGIIVIGIITSVFTLTKCGQMSGLVDTPPATEDPALPPKPDAPKSKPPKSITAITKKNSPKASVEKKTAPKSAIPKGGFTSEKALIDALVKAIRDKNPELLFELTGQSALSKSARENLSNLLKKGDLRLDPQQPLTAIGRTQNSTRWALRLLSSSNELIEIITDLTKDPLTGWKVLKMRPPVDKKMIAANAGNSAKTGPAGDTEKLDALMVAYTFAKAAINLDIKTARALTNPDRLNAEKLVALLIALEEGAFRLKIDKPLIVTLARDDLTWAITRVESGNMKTEFGVEMNLSKDGRWTVSGLTFSKLITMTAAAAGAGNVAYSPIRINPQGGESLVLYFEFDNEQVSARTRKQLVIVASILSQENDRKIHINGHADAKGEDGYNVTLSKLRTSAVKNILIELGVSPEQIVTKAFGETMPLKPNFKADGSDNPNGRAQNRRTEIYLDF